MKTTNTPTAVRQEIVHVLPGRIWGGAEQYVLDLSRHLGHSCSVTFVAYDTEAVRKALRGVPVTVHYISPKASLTGSATQALLGRLMQNAAVVHIHDTAFVCPVIKAKEASGSRARVFLTRHIARASRVMPWRRKWFLKLDRMVFVSDLAKCLWTGVNTWMPADKTVVIHNSVPPVEKREYCDEGIRERFGIAADTPLLVFTGRVRKSKGCAVIVNALSQLADRDFAMVFVGACKPLDYHRRLMSLARKGGIAGKVFFYGFSRDARQLIKEADIGVAPSIVREAFHLSPLEFMAEGKCVITSDNGAQREFVDDGITGLLVPPGDVSALASALGKVLDDKQLREQLGDNARREVAENHSYNNFVNSVMRTYFY